MINVNGKTIFKLTSDTIDLISDAIAEMYEELGCSTKEILKARLLFEEALLKYQTKFGEDIDVSFRRYKILNQYRFSVRIESPSFDPFSMEENPMAFMIKNIMSSFEDSLPSWSYKNMQNEIVCTVRKKAHHNEIYKISIALMISIIGGIIARIAIPFSSLSSFVSNYLDPVANAYAGLFCIMAVLITFFSIIFSIVSIGDINAVGSIGGKMMKRFYKISVIAVALLTIPIIPFFSFTGHAEISLAIKSIYDILVGLVPSNIVSPFLNFNSVHIMAIGCMFGFSMLALGHKTDTIKSAFDECNVIAVTTNTFLNKFIAIYVGLKMFAIITASDFSSLKASGTMVGVILLGEALIFVFFLLRGSQKTGTSISEYSKRMLPPVVVTLSSANFGASVSSIFDSMFSFGIDPSMANLGLNLGSVFFQPSCTLVFMVSSLFMAKQFGVSISIVWLFMAFILSVLLVAAVPNVPGATVAVITLLYSQLGLPAEAISMMIAVNALLQFFTVSVDVWCLESEIVCFAIERKKKD